MDGLNQNSEILRVEDLRKMGKEKRKTVSFSEQGIFYSVDRDPVEIIEAQNVNRIQNLISLRKERMSVSPFAFFRGSAILMAKDLENQAKTGFQLVICGDAHLNNFGFYASPERRLVFDLNDFDEAAPGSWEWDLKRLVTSVILCGEEIGLKKKEVKESALKAAILYRIGLRYMLNKGSLERYYTMLSEEDMHKVISKKSKNSFEKMVKKAKKSGSEGVIEKFTTLNSMGERVFIEKPPVLTHLKPEIKARIAGYYEAYLKTVPPDIALFLSQHRLTDIARRVVGVGSVGTNCYILALTSNNGSHIILQMKEASESVISLVNHNQRLDSDPLIKESGEGYRVVKYQKILQAVSDPFLGHLKTEDGKYFYLRQFRDMKGSYEMHDLTYDGFIQYVGGCGYLLARGHAQSPQSIFVDGYMGSSDKFDEAIVSWCYSYSQQVYQDYEKFIK
ncbi:MAG: DUF2252 domain-containing protein [Eubacteriaceae bacterium]